MNILKIISVLKNFCIFFLNQYFAIFLSFEAETKIIITLINVEKFLKNFKLKTKSL